jgi:Cu(I)/Ag(I) efflux system membrane protein CusA/SilA
VIGKILDFSAQQRGLVLGAVAALFIASLWAMGRLPLDAIPDLSEPQVIVFSEWTGRSPPLVEDQLTYPLVSALLAAPRVTDVRGYSMFGMSFVYVIFEEGTDVYWARSRVLEYLSASSGRLPEGVTPRLGPDASGVGWVYQYVLEDERGEKSLDELRTLQDFTLRYALESVSGVAEVASIGGYAREYQLRLDPRKLLAYGLSFADVADAVRGSSGDVGGRMLELSGREYYVRGRAYVESTADLERIAVRAEPGQPPVLVRDVATVTLGPGLRRGVLDWNGRGEAVGGIVVMRYGENAHQLIERVKHKIAELEKTLPEGVRIVEAYDRSSLIDRAIATLRTTLLEEMLVVAAVVCLFLMHLRSALLPIVSLPVAVALAFLPMVLFDVPATIMSLGGIAIAIGATVDAEIVMIEAAHKALENPPPGVSRRTLLARAAREVTPAIFFSLLIIAVSFLPVFALTGQAGRLFKPLAYTKTFVMLSSALLSITFAPALRDLLIRGRIRKESEHPVSRAIRRVYEPFVYVALRNPRSTLLIGAFALVSAVPLYGRLGSEFMPTLDEGDLLYMPTTYPGIAIEQVKAELTRQDAILKSFPEVKSVFGKAGRAESPTDPAPLSMVETTVQLYPKERWRRVKVERFFSTWPGWLKAPLAYFLPEERPLGEDELTAELDQALTRPGFTNAWTMPIKARIDMQSTGIRTPIGIKVFGDELADIEQTGVALEALVRTLPGTRGVFYERNMGGMYVDVVPDRDKLARAGLSLGDVAEAVEAAVGGAPLGNTLDGRGRFAINARIHQDARDDVAALGRLPLAVPTVDAKGARGFVPLGEVARIEVNEGPPMLRDEDGMLVGYVYVDVHAEHDVGRYVEAARAAVDDAIGRGALPLAEGVRLSWSGQYELMQETNARLAMVVPLALAIVVLLLYLAFRNFVEVLIVLLSIPFALVGSVWLLYLLDYRLSTAVWVGVVALVGLATQTGVVMIIYIDAAYNKRKARGLIRSRSDVVWAHLEGTVQRVRPKLMTVSTMLLGLVPLLWAEGSGADVMKRVAAPMVGGLFTSTFLTLELIPVIYTYWRTEQLRWDELRTRDARRFAWLEAAAQLQWTGWGVALGTLLLSFYVAVPVAWQRGLIGCALAAALGGLGAYLVLRRTPPEPRGEVASPGQGI